jgi:hypothetical protein
MARNSGVTVREESETGSIWSTVPLAHSPKGFAALPYPWQTAKADALAAQGKVAALGNRASARPAEAARAKGVQPPVKGPSAPAALRANLTDLADRFGLDKGSTQHRYAELYNMLLHPWRDRSITFLEIGLCSDAPAQDRPADLPSLLMWLEFLPGAQVHRLDRADLSWFRHDRLAFHRCDMDDRASIAATGAQMPEFDIILDDASHASHHQQNGFLELFPRLRSGGLYIIEDLRWQPETYEKPGITKTAALFRSFSETHRFAHDDKGVETAFNALAPEISGCFLFQAGYDKKRKDQVAVIHKR